MHQNLDDIEKVAELIFYSISTIVLVKTTWFENQNSHKKKRKKRSKRKR